MNLLDKYDIDIDIIDISKNNIIGILDLENKFANLIKLDCSDNKITELKGLGDKLIELNCYNNRITKFRQFT